MTEKNFVFILITMLMVLIIMGGVNAGDLNHTDDVVSVDGAQASVSLKSSSNSTSGAVLKATDQDVLGGSFSDLSNEINGKSGDITLSEDYSGGGYGDGIWVNNDITSITGNKGGAPVVLDANNDGRIFNIADGSTITFKNIKFVGGNQPQEYQSGGAINVGGNCKLTFIDCTFERNYAGMSSSVAISTTSSVKFVNCLFDNNGADGGWTGGTLVLSSTGNQIINCTFSNNFANKYGGGAIAIQAIGNHISGSKFINNYGGPVGGAIYIGVTDYECYNNYFINNSALNSGAIYLVGDNNNLNNCTFISNHATNEGGALQINARYQSVINCRFINNTAGTYGGAITFANAEWQAIRDCYFEENSAQYGGAIFCFNGGGYYNPNSISHCEFIKNHVSIDGGAIYFSKTGGVSVNSSTFIENNALHNGGALYAIGQDGLPYVDYDGFKRNGIKASYGDEFTWSVKVDQLTYEYVLKCKFVDNTDYRFAIGTSISGLTAVIKIFVPQNYTLTDDAVLKFNITYQNGTVSQYTFTKADVEDGAVNLQLSNLAMEEYKLSASFDDGDNYFYKIISDSFVIVEPKGDFRILQELIDETIANYTGTGIPTLFLSRNYIFTPDLDHGQMNITQSIIIYGNGFYIDALNYCRIFKITANQVSIRDTEFRNGNATGSRNDGNPRGGAIYWTGESGYIYRAVFTNNTAFDGGAVFVNARAGQGKITESTFSNNKATNHGGAIDWNASGGYLEDSLLYNNSADYGGAVYVGASGVSSHITGSSFISNNATYRGGAVDWYSSSGDLEDSYFENNHADYGGAVFVGHQTDGGKIYNTNFVNNTADVRGGAIDWNASRGSVELSTFNYNKAPYGGAIFVGSQAEGGYIFKSTFTGNIAEFNGGAIDWNASSGNLNGSTFIDNKAYNGGAVFVGASGSAGHIIYSTFRNNTAENRGGAVDWYASSGEIYNSTFNLNHAYDGGAVFVGKSSDGGQITYSTFTSNVATHKGGAIDWNATSGILSYSVFNSNEAYSGGAVFVGSSTNGGTIYRSNFTSNKASFKGGAIDWNATSGHLNESIFRSNVADYGGAVFVGSSTDGGAIYKSTFEGNIATYNGGAVDWNASSGYINESTFTNNRANHGGAIFVGANTDGGTIYKSTFTYNTATLNGGAIDWNASSGFIDSSDFRYNTAYNGGAVFVGAQGSAGKIYNAIFQENNATNRGGAVDWFASSGDLEESTFISNHAYDGGAVFVGTSTDGGKIYKSTFTSNTATHKGGAIDWNASRGNLSYSVFNYNEADYGGAVFVGASTTNGIFNYSNFTGNKARYNGGAIDWNASSGNLQNSRFSSNSATNGGAVFVGASGDAGHIINSYFSDNHASERGGAVDWFAASGDIEDSTFTSNGAKYGGAVFVGRATEGGKIINSVFASNTATLNGGAIDWNATSGDVENSLFTDNHADYGGAVFVGHQTQAGKIINSNFTSNSATHNGGAIDWNATSGDVEGSIFRANTAEFGGAIFVGQYTSDGKVINSKFYSNGATYNGGAIDWNASSGHVEDSLFERNYAGNGGAIFAGTATENSKIIRSEFNYNSATHNGGAIDWNASRGAVEDSLFTHNEADYGGAIFVGQSSSNGYITRSNFTLNSATRGGAIDWNASSGNVSDSRFERNNAVNGGAIFVGHGADKGSVYNSYFNLNSAEENGGAILFNNISDASVSQSQFISNSANNGGAIYVQSCDKFLVNGSEFNRNTAENSSGAIHWEGDDGDLYYSTFSNNEAKTSDGGAIGWFGGDGQLFNITFTDNKAGRHGGAVYWDQTKKGIVNQSTFKDNVASGNGGALYWNADSQDVIENSIFYHNQAMDGGAIIWLDSDGGRIYNNNFTYNVALNDGGAIMGENGSNIVIEKNIFDNNRATGYTNFENIDYGQGGAIFWSNGDNLTLADANFTRNGAHVAGGAVAIFNSDDAKLYDLNFVNSSSENIGGALYIKNSDQLDIHDMELTKSSANNNGGGAYFEDSTGTVENVKFDKSSSNWGTAGAIYVDGNIDFNNLNITDSSALNSLGQSVVFVGGTSTLSNSSTNDENAIVIGSGATVNLTKVKNTDNKEGLYSVLNGGILSLEKNEFDNVIINANTILTQTYTTILDNKTIIVEEGDSVMLNSTIYDDNNNIIVISNDVNGMIYDFFQFIELKDNETFTTIYTDKHNFAEYRNVKNGEHVISTATFGGYNERAGGLIKNTLKTGTIIAKAKSSLNITVEQTNEGEVVTIKAQVHPSDATGNVTFKINDQIYTPVKIDDVTGIATFVLHNVSAGTYTVTATYNGDESHFNVTNNTIFVVKLREISLRIDVGNIYFGLNATAVVTTNATNGTGVVIINGRQYQIKIKNGIASVNATDLKPGNYSAMVLYNSNEYYKYNFNSTNFTVYKLNTTIEATPTSPIGVGGVERVTVKVNNTATGYVKITIDSKEYIEKVTNGEAVFEITGLSEGEYADIPVEYLGDDYFNSNKTSISFTVGATDNYDIVVIAPATKEGENATIYVIMPRDATGNVSIWVDNTLYENVSINSNGIASINVTGLAVGPHIVNVTYVGDEKYAAKDKNGTLFDVYKASSDDYNLNITVDANPYGENTVISVELPEDISGDINITIDGKNYTVSVTSGKGSLTLNNLYAGLHEVVIKYGDEKYPTKTNSTMFYINQAKSQITLTINNTDVIASVISGATGNVTFYINGREETVEIINGNATLRNVLTIGNNTIIAIYNGDENFTSSRNSTNITVSKTQSFVNVSVEDTVYGNDALIIVKVGDGQTGFVTININNQNITKEIKNGQATFTVSKLDASRYRVNVTYLGDDAYATETNFTYFNVTKANLTANVIGQNVSVGENTSFIIDINDDFKGNVNIAVGDLTYDNIIKALIEMGQLPAGNYTANVKFYGDDNYNNKSLTVNFTVKRLPTTITVDIPNTIYPNNATATVTVSGNANGTLTITVGDNTYSANVVNGQAEVNLTGLTAGFKEAAIEFTTNDNYNDNATSAFNFEVIKANSTVVITNSGNDVIASVTPGAMGNVTFYVNGRKHTVLINNGQAIWENALTAGNNTVIAIYDGDNNYNSSRNSTNISNSKIQTTITVDVESPINVGDIAVINITTTGVSDAIVQLRVGDNVYNVAVVGGKGQFNVSSLANGTYNVNATYAGDDVYINSNSNIETLEINKVPVNITVVVNTPVHVGEDAIITIKLNESLTTVVSVKVDDNTYNVGIVNGEGQLNITMKNAGTHNIEVKYSGDDKYLSSNNITSFEVIKSDKLDMDLSVVNITYGETETIIVTVNATGNVIIKVGDYTEEVSIENGKAILEINGLLVNNYTVNVTYAGDDYENITAEANFTVQKADPLITVEVHDIPYGEVEHIIVRSNVDGEVTIKVNGETKVVSLNNGFAILRVSSIGNIVNAYDGRAGLDVYNLAVGTYDVEVEYAGSENYNKLTTSAEFEVYQINTTLDVKVEDITVWDKESINITVNETINGTVTVNINGENYTVKITNGLGQLNLTNLTVGNKTVWVFFDGNNNFTANRTMKTFEVFARTPSINVTAVNIAVGSKTDITVEVPENATGYIIIRVNNQDFMKTVTDGRVKFEIEGLGEGTYPVDVKYVPFGNENYTTNTTSASFKVSKLNTTIKIIAENVTYDGSVNITVIVNESAGGTITIKINNTLEKTLPVVDGKVTWIADDLAAGVYNVTATYNNNEVYAENETSKLFEVKKATPVITIEIGDVEIGKSATVTIKINSTATGNLTGRIGNQIFNQIIENGQVVITTDVLTNKTYDIEVNYAGDRNYTSGSVSDSFNVAKDSDYSIVIDAEDINVGDLTNITVYVPSDAEGIVTIEINGTNYTAVINNGKAVFEYQTGLKAGKYDVVAYFGDSKYANKTAVGSFTISKVNIPIVVNVDSIYVGDKAIINVTVPSGIANNITIEINGKKYNKTVDADGKAVFEISDLAYGNKTVTVTYAGDDKYVFNSTTAQFEVLKRNSTIKIDVENTTAGSDVLINIAVPSNATGNVVVNVSGTNYNVNLTDGKGTLTVKNIGSGSYTINATYLGDEQYLSSNNFTTFNAGKLNTTVIIKVDDVTYPDKVNITIEVENGATGNITVKINDTEYGDMAIVNGKVSLTVDKLQADNYTVYATYNGDNNYNINSTSKVFEVKKATPTITIEIGTVEIGKSSTVTIKINSTATGNLIGRIGDQTFNQIIENGQVEIITDALTNKTYDIEVTYDGDKNYASGSASASFNVAKDNDYNIIINAEDIKVGELTNITVYVPSDAEGIVTLEINGTNYTATINNDKAVFENQTNLKAGKYDIAAYFGDSKYANKTAVGSFTVSKVNIPIIVNVDSIYVGDKAVINVTVPVDITNNITVEIDGKKYNMSVDANGKTVFEIANLTYGNKTVTVTYAGDDKYVFNSTTAQFEVLKRNSTIKIGVENTTVGRDVLINITVPSNATGNVVVDINGTKYNVNITDGKGTLTVKNLESGNYTITATYLGDNQYLTGNNKTTFKVDKVNSFITITPAEGISSISEGSDVDLIINVPDDVVGKVIVTVDDGVANKSYTVYVHDGEGVLHIEKPAVGVYEVFVNYTSNNKYFQSSATTSFEVYSSGGNLTVKTEPVIHVNETEDILVEISGKHEGNVTITIVDANDNVVNITNATFEYDGENDFSYARFAINDLNAGDYTVKAVYLENTTVIMEHTGSNTFKVIKLDTKLTINPIANITVGENATIKFTVNPANASENITVYVNGIKYVINTTNLTLIIPGLGENEYIVNAFYDGDNNYNPSNATAKFHVFKNNVTVDVKVENITVKDTESINITLPDDVNGIVLINVNGTKYYGDVVNGNAQLNLTDLKAGDYTVNVTFIGDNKYYANSTVNSFKVSKLNTTLTINVDDVTYPDKVNIVIEVENGVTGNITVRINDTNYSDLGIVNGKVTLTVDKPAGNYTVYATYNGDVKYNINSTSKTFEVKKATPTITIEVGDAEAGKTTTITIKINSTATGNLTGRIGDQEFNEKIVNGQITIMTGVLANKTYDIEVSYEGDGNYTSGSARSLFNVAKADDYNINIDAKDIKVGELTNITVYVPGDAEGIVTLEINGTNYTAVINNGKAVFENQTDLKAGKYNITAYFGDSKYANKTATGAFTISKVNTPINIDVDSIYVGDKAIINVTAPADVVNNINIEIDGKKYNMSIDSNGKAVFEIANLTYGNKTVTVTYAGDDKYVFNSTTAQFEVLKRNSTVKIEIEEISAGSGAVINITVPANATGHVIIDFNGTKYVINITDGKATFTVKNVNGGDYTINATYLGDEQYLSSNNSTTLKVSKLNTPITIKVDNATYPDKVNIAIEVENGASGNITVKINDTEYGDLTIVNGKVNLTVDKPAGNYTVYATYNGDAKYNTNSTSKTFEVKKATPIITIDVSNVKAGENATITIKINSTATGNLTVKVGDETFNEKIENGQVVITTGVLANKTYDIEVSYEGDRNYTSGSAISSFNVAKADDYNINIDAKDIKVGELTNITVYVPGDAEGIVTLEINGTNYTATINNGKAVFENQTGLKVGKYNITAYFGDSKYANKTATGSFTVFKVDTPIDIGVDSIYVGDKAIVNVTVPNNIINNITIEIDGKKYNMSVDANGKAVFEIPNLTYGNKTVIVSYAGDDKYVFNSTTAQFEVLKRNSTVKIEIEEISAGNDAVINITVPANATGHIIVDFNGTKYAVNITDGKGSLTVKNVNGGDYTINATYLGDEQYFSSNNGTTLKVSKLNTPITIKVDDATYPGKVNIVFGVSNGATGNITVKINDTEYADFEIKNGKASLTVNEIASGNYTVYATYNGDDKYNINSTSKTFEVKKATPTITIEVGEVKAGESARITVKINSTATGNLTVKVGDETFNRKIENGQVIITTSALANKTYDIEVSYEGDNNYTVGQASKSFNVAKADDYNINIDAKDIKVGDLTNITVYVPSDAGGIVTLEINGTNYTALINNGKAVFENQTNLNAGKYNITAYFSDSKYANKTATGSFTISKVNTPIGIELNPIVVVGDIQITVTAPNDLTENITVEIDGKKYNRSVDTNGRAVFEIPNLTYGNKTVIVSYAGDDKYLFNSTTAQFEVIKRNSTVNVKVDNVTVGEDVVINVTVPGDATKYVILEIGDDSYIININNGFGSKTIKNLGNGTYDINVTYVGDEKYLESTNKTTFKVSKVPSSINVAVENTTVGKPVVLVITTPEDATGDVTVKIGNKTYNIKVGGGQTQYVVNDLPVGNYTVNVTYSGNGKYEASRNTTNFSVSKLTPNINIVDLGNGTVKVIVCSNATGNVTVKVGDNTYTANLTDGVAFIDLAETPGKHEVNATYNGDKNYNVIVTTGEATIPKYSTPLDITVSDIKVGDNETVTVKVPGGATGIITVEIDGKKYTHEIENGQVTFTVENLTSGNKTIYVKYNGDDSYNPNCTTKQFNVSKRNSTVSVKVDNVTVGDDIIINVTVPGDATKYVIIKVGDESYIVDINNGFGSKTIKNLGKGTYEVNVTYVGDDKYLESTNKTTFKVSKVPSTVSVKVENITEGESAVLVITTPEDANGNVTIKIGDDTYTIKVGGGQTQYVVKDLPLGNYTVNVTYSGNDKYESNINSTTFSVLKSPEDLPKNPTPLDINVSDIKVGDNEIITVKVPRAVTGNITIEIDGKKYTGKIENGEAKFTVQNLTYGNKTVTVTYAGNDRFAFNSTTAQFSVFKRNSTVNVEINDTKVGNNVTVKVSVPENATGQVLIDIDGVGNFYVNVTNGGGSIEIPRVPDGKYKVTVTYVGDKQYNGSSTRTNFTVSKYDSFVNPGVQNITVGDNEVITVYVPQDASGNVTITVDGKEYTVAVNGGKGEITIPKLPAGVHNVTAKYNGDEKYLPSSEVKSNFTVSKHTTQIGVIDNGNGSVTIIISDNATGNVTVKVGDNTYAANITNGTAIVNLDKETSGKHEIEVKYSGDNNYYPASATASVSIPKYSSPISVSVGDIYVGDAAGVSVTVPNAAGGKVTIEIDGRKYTADVKDGKAIFNIPGLIAGDKTVAVTYSGDDDYSSNFTTAQFKVLKRSSTISATSKDIKVGKNEVITVTVPGDATGRVLVDINGIGYYGNVINGKSSIVVPELPSGKYKATVTYEGDGKYSPSSTTTSFTVTKVKSTIVATGDEVSEGEDATVVVKVPKDATGTVTITVGGKKYTREVINGKAVFKVSGLSKGDHGVSASYSGNKKYEENSTITDIDVYYKNTHQNTHYKHSSKNKVLGANNLTKHLTGNPIVLLLLIVLVLTSTQIRRFKK